MAAFYTLSRNLSWTASKLIRRRAAGCEQGAGDMGDTFAAKGSSALSVRHLLDLPQTCNSGVAIKSSVEAKNLVN